MGRSSLEALKQRFEEQAGWRYGLAAGLTLVLSAWGWDAVELWQASQALFWIKVLPALLTVLPLSVLAGWLAARMRQAVLAKSAIWAIWGAAVGYLAMHFPFDWASAIAGLTDSVAGGITLFPFSDLAQFRSGLTIFFGIAAALLVTLFQILATEWAWDRSTEEASFTPAAASLLLIVVPIVWVLGALDDGMANADLRSPIELTGRMVDTALHAPPNLDTSKMSSEQMLEYLAGMQWRGQVSERFVQYLVDYDLQSFASVTTDLAFDNGLILRCQVIQYGRYIGGCFDLATAYQTFMREFIDRGTATCGDCTVKIEPAALTNAASFRSAFGPQAPISIVHHLGGIVLVDATGRDGHHLICRLIGAQPVVIHDCKLQ